MFRPDNISQLFGQDHLYQLLETWHLDQTKIPKSILFHGPFGTGKTSTARIIAKGLVSTNNDLTEINAAESRGIEQIREIAESSKYSPFGKAKVYIIDELHQMTQVAQSALLKVIEEPPAKVYFFLCTTEPYKLLPALSSRCTIVELKLLDENSSMNFIKFLKPKIPESQFKSIITLARGHAREIVKLSEFVENGGVLNTQIVNSVFSDLNNLKKAIEKILHEFDIEKQNKLIKDLFLCSFGLENNQLGIVIDQTIDEFLLSGLFVEFATDFMMVRSKRKEYLITAQDQLVHLLSKTKQIIQK